MKRIVLAIILLSIFSACKKKEIDIDPAETAEESGQVDLHIKTVINGKKIIPFNTQFVNLCGDTFKISSLRYYISNVKLKKSDGTFYAPEGSYYLMDVSKKDSILNVLRVPFGTYTQLEFSIGVDSVRNHSGAQTGALDPVYQMIWTWQTGYKFVSLQGKWKDKSGVIKVIDYDIAEDINYKTFIFNASLSNWSDIVVQNRSNSTMHIALDFGEMFKTPNTICFDTLSNVQSGHAMQTIANNYVDMHSLF